MNNPLNVQNLAESRIYMMRMAQESRLNATLPCILFLTLNQEGHGKLNSRRNILKKYGLFYNPCTSVKFLWKALKNYGIWHRIDNNII